MFLAVLQARATCVFLAMCYHVLVLRREVQADWLVGGAVLLPLQDAGKESCFKGVERPFELEAV